MRFVLKLRPLIYIISFLILSDMVYSYPNFVGYGYQSCLTCHYNPYGNGPLTDYGRGVGATVISDRIIYSKKTTEDSIGLNSGFLFRPPMSSWLRPSADYRGMYLKSAYDTKQEESQTIHMQANVNLVVRLGPKENRDKFFLLGTIGYAPTPLSDKKSTEPNWRSREHYIGYRPIESLGIYLGFMDRVFGIRLPDHISFSRSATSNTMNDQTHGLLLHYYRPTFELALHTFLGNMEQKKIIRQKGLSSKLEYSINKKARLGASFITSESKFLKQTSLALHSKLQFGKGSSSMLEIGQSDKKIILNNKNNKSLYLMMQNHLYLKRGLLALVTGEYFKPNKTIDNKVLRLGPGLQYFPFQSIELRLDVFNTRIFSDVTVSDDSWDMTGQLHLWF